MITFQQLHLRRGQHLLLKDVNWTIYHKQRIGLIGANGAGKTSLFSLLLNQIQPDAGDLTIPKQLRMAHVAQETPGYADSALDFVLDGDTELRDLEKELVAAELADDGMKMGAIHEKLSIIDAYTAKSRAAQLLAGLGFEHEEHSKSVSEFSGGWRVRLNLAKALMCRSDVLLLDEPTNHLDLDAVIWLEQWLQKYHGTLILISHDRDFLDHTVDHIAHISHQTLTVYTGNYSTFETLRAQQLMHQQAAFEKQQRQIAHMQKFIDRFKAKATKARQAQSRVKAIERMDIVCAVQTESEFHFNFKEPKSCPNPLLQLDFASIAYGEKQVLQRVNLSLTANDRIGILGPNGAGKSSLIKLLAGVLPPAAGSRFASSELKIGYFAQHQVDHLDLQATPLLHMQRLSPHTSDQELRTFLGSFGFSHTRVFEPIHNFSGGEKSRLALAMIVWQKPNLLLLDEPTNHLDMEMRNALSIALQEYTGAMLLVSHDRFLLRTTTDKLILVANQRAEEYAGTVDDYQQWLFDYRKQKTAEWSAGKREVVKPAPSPQVNLKPLLASIEKLEKRIETLEKKLNNLEMQLTEQSLYLPENKAKLQTLLSEQVKLKEDLTLTETDWLRACEKRDNSLS